MRLRYWLTAPDRGRDAHLVVVEHDDHARLALADVVERLQREAAHERRVTHHDGDRARSPPRRSRASARPSAMERPVPAWPPSMTSCTLSVRRGKPPMPPSWRSVPKLVQATGQQLVGVGLVAGVPDDAVGRAGEQAVQGHRQLHDAQRAAQVAAGLRDRVDDVSRISVQSARASAWLMSLRSLRLRGGRASADHGSTRSSPSSGRRSTRRGAPAALPSTSRWTRSSAASRSRAQCVMERDAALVQGDGAPRAAGRPPRVAPTTPRSSSSAWSKRSALRSSPGAAVPVACGPASAAGPVMSVTCRSLARLPPRRPTRRVPGAPRAGRPTAWPAASTHDAPSGVAHDGVAALERGEGIERGQAGGAARRGRPAPGRAGAHQRRQPVGRARQRRARRRRAGRARRAWRGRAAGRCARAPRPGRRPVGTVSRLRRSASRLARVRRQPAAGGGGQAQPRSERRCWRCSARVGHDQLGRDRRRGGPDVGRELRERHVRLVADADHDRPRMRGDGAHDGLLVEGPEVLERAAAAGEDDDVHGAPRGRVRPAAEAAQRADDGLLGTRALHLAGAHDDARQRPAARDDAVHVVEDGARQRGDDADASAASAAGAACARRRRGPPR